jgi:dihydrofolate reductase
MLTAIACLDRNFVIAKDNALAYRLPEDLKNFRKLTLNKTIFVGKSTYQECKHLPDRNWVELTRSNSQELLTAARNSNEEYFLGGGAKVFQAELFKCQKLYLSIPHVTQPLVNGPEYKYFNTAYPICFRKKGTIRFKSFTFEEWVTIT